MRRHLDRRPIAIRPAIPSSMAVPGSGVTWMESSSGSRELLLSEVSWNRTVSTPEGPMHHPGSHSHEKPVLPIPMRMWTFMAGRSQRRA